jgi:hypothetical protein
MREHVGKISVGNLISLLARTAVCLLLWVVGYALRWGLVGGLLGFFVGSFLLSAIEQGFGLRLMPVPRRFPISDFYFAGGWGALGGAFAGTVGGCVSGFRVLNRSIREGMLSEPPHD